MNQPVLSAADEWRKHWTLVAASMAGISFVALASASIGLFMDPLSREFGWSRTEITAGLTIYAIVAVPLSPLVGAMVDRWGARRVAVPGVIATAAAFAAFGLANGSTLQWLALWALFSLVAVAVRNTVWTTAVSGTFNRARGLALGFTLSGSAVSATLIPVLANSLIETRGWRSAYAWIGLGWGTVILVLVFFFFFDVRDVQRRKPTTALGAPVELPGLSFAEALRNPVLIRIAIATLLITLLNSAIYVHLVPMLGARGMDRDMAAFMAALAGGMAIAGRLFTGWLLDRWASGWINALSLALPALACVILLVAETVFPLIVVAVVVVGYSLGSFMQVCVYLTSQYVGIRNFGKIFGVISSLIAMGPGVGPLLASLVYDVTGDYNILLLLGIPTALLCGLLVYALGPYPDWEETAAPSAS